MASSQPGEIDKWKYLPRSTYKAYEDDDGVINEFLMMWEHREEFPRHFVVFKQCAAHLHHEANVEQIFSLAGRIADPSLDPEHLQRMVQVNFNKKFHMPTIENIRAKYYSKYRKAGSSGSKLDVEKDEVEDGLV